MVPYRQVEHECVKGAQRHQAAEIGVHFQQVSVSVVFEERKPQFLNRDAIDIQQSAGTIKQIVHIPMLERTPGTGQRPFLGHRPVTLHSAVPPGKIDEDFRGGPGLAGRFTAAHRLPYDEIVEDVADRIDARRLVDAAGLGSCCEPVWEFAEGAEGVIGGCEIVRVGGAGPVDPGGLQPCLCRAVDIPGVDRD
jgi:hypothetical protein